MTITQIKAQLSLSQVIDHYGLKPDRNDRLCCPWHQDKTPSLQLYPKTNTWTCFSSNCSAGSGDVIDFVMRYEKLTKHEALKKCKVLLGATIQKKVLSEKGLDLEKLFIKMRDNYYQGAKAKSYAKSRKLDQFKIGYNGTLYAHLQYCLVFPLRNEQGKIVSFYGRSIYDLPNQKHYYLKNRSGLYPKYPEAKTKRIILTESVIDSCFIKEPVLALYGTNGITEEHIKCLSGLPDLEEIVLFMDGDDAGREAIEKISKRLQKLEAAKTWKLSHVETPEGEDINSLVVTHDDYESLLEELIKNRKPINFSFSIESSGSSEITNSRSTESTHLNECLSGLPDKKILLEAEHQELLRYEDGMFSIYILGGLKMTGLDKLRVTLKITRAKTQSKTIRSSLDLYQHKQVLNLINRLHEAYELSHQVLNQAIDQLIDQLEQYRMEMIGNTPKEQVTKSYQMTAAERAEALAYLKAPDLLNRTTSDIAASGVIGETHNALIGHLAYITRKRYKPLHVMYLGKSGSGKTYLQEKLSELIPDEDKKSVTSLSDQSLYYQGKQLQHKVLLIEDIDGAENVLYVIRELQSKGSIRKNVVWKDPKGNMQSMDVVAEGPVCISSCTTRESVYEDNANRCILLYIDDSDAQDIRIMEYQRKLSAGKINRIQQQEIKKLHQNVQRMLKPIQVINPYAEFIELPKQVFKPRRTLQLLLGFIEAITFYHQWQRSGSPDGQTYQLDGTRAGDQYILSTVEDVEAGFRLLKEVLFTKSDELSQACRGFLERLKSIVPDGQSFYVQQIRKQLRIANATAHRYIRALHNHGYLKYVGGSKNQGYEYQIVDYDEYQNLQSSIDHKLDEILQKIKNSSDISPVSQSHNGMNKQQNTKALEVVSH